MYVFGNAFDYIHADLANGMKYYNPSMILCTDNGAMIGSAGYFEYMKGVRSDITLNANPNLKIGER